MNEAVGKKVIGQVNASGESEYRRQDRAGSL